ncbi:MAG: hypothetical protein ACTHLW_07285, partial [Verrucomicrobiota bacterium]
VQFYANAVENLSGFGEGRTYLGSTNVTTGSGGNVNFSVVVNAAVPPGYFLSATATDRTNSTSEFSANVLVWAPPSLSFTWTNSTGQLIANGLAWPTNPVGFSLLEATNLTPPVVWTAATNLVATSGGTNSIHFGRSTGNRFYQLRSQ